ncbi:hypothetical protein ACRAQ6_14030 [Erythrobacter sp. HA6-11]
MSEESFVSPQAPADASASLASAPKGATGGRPCGPSGRSGSEQHNAHVRSWLANLRTKIEEQREQQAREDAAAWIEAIESGRLTQSEAATMQQMGMLRPPEPFSYSREASFVDLHLAFCGQDCPITEAGLDASHLLNEKGEERVLAAGIPRSLLGEFFIAGDIWQARVDLIQRGERFQLGGPDGRLVIAVRDADFERVDALALALHNADEWALLTGHASFLGEWNLAAVERDHEVRTKRCHPRTLRLHSTPLGWLRAGGEGIAVLDWSVDALARLRALGERVVLRCDAGAQRRLKGLLMFGGLPRITEKRPMRPESEAA